jgi:thymidylate synthase (FAD)
MKIVNPSIEILRTGLELEPIIPEQLIEKVGRTCYKSEDKITEDSAAPFTLRFIKWGHESVLEHWSAIYKTDKFWYDEIRYDYAQLRHDLNIPMTKRIGAFLRFTHCTTEDGVHRCIISGNMRAWREFAEAYVTGYGCLPRYMYGMVRCNPLFFPEYQEWVPVNIVNDILIPIAANDLIGPDEHGVHHDVTVKFTTDRGVSHEIVRHRPASYAQESTRYCNYAQDKFGSEITVVRPSWCKDPESDIWKEWEMACRSAESNYFLMLDKGCSPQEARSVLPNSLKTELVMTANINEWNHFFHLRCAQAAHPDIRELATMWRELYKDFGLDYIQAAE